MRLHNLPAPKGGNKKRKRLGRGEASGRGKTSGKGMKGQKSRTGKGKPRAGFEGGQVPMYRRMPKRGFTNVFRKKFAVINVDTLGGKFDSGATVDLEAARAAGLATKTDVGLRIIGRGELSHALTVTADHVSESAREKIEKAGGSVTVIEKAESAPTKRSKRAARSAGKREKRREDFAARRAAKQASPAPAASEEASAQAE